MMFGSRFSGYVEVMVTGKDIAGLLNSLAEEGISLRDVAGREAAVTFCVASELLSAVRRKAHDHGCFVTIRRRGGLTFYRKYFRRHGYAVFTAGAVLLLLWGVFSMVWRVDVAPEEGTILNAEERAMILAAAEECGLKTPGLRSAVDQKETAAEILARCPFLSWVGLSAHGVTMTVCVAERHEEDRSSERHGHIVADRDGTVRRIFVWKGQKLVEPGDRIRSGDILISGDIVYEEEGKEPVYDHTAANGVISAAVCYEGVAYTALTGEKLTATGQKAGILRLEGYGRELILWGNEQDPFLRSVIKEGKASFFGLKLSFQTYCEATAHRVQLREKDAEAAAEKKAGELAQAQLRKDSVLLDRKVEVLHDREGAIGVRVILVCEEKIGKFKALP